MWKGMYHIDYGVSSCQISSAKYEAGALASNGSCLYGWLPPFRDFTELANLNVNYVKYKKKQLMIFAT